LIFSNPNVPVNPFPPPTVPVAIVLPSNTPEPPRLPPTWTPTITTTPLPTETPKPPTATATIVGGNFLLTPSATQPEVQSNYAFVLKSAPAAIDASVLYPDRGDCKWMGVGGQVLDLQGRPVTGITIMLGGSVDGKLVDQTSLTGTALKYGEAGYEFTLDSQSVRATKGAYWVRLVDQQKLPLSAKVYFDTFDDCQKNLIVINFRQVR